MIIHDINTLQFVNNIYLNGEIEIEHGLLKRKTPISSDGQVVFETEKLNEISENETAESNSEEEPEEEPASENQSATDTGNLEEYRQCFFMNGETSSDDDYLDMNESYLDEKRESIENDDFNSNDADLFDF